MVGSPRRVHSDGIPGVLERKRVERHPTGKAFGHVRHRSYAAREPGKHLLQNPRMKTNPTAARPTRNAVDQSME